MKLKIRTGATVEVISGTEKGRKGSVLAIDAQKMRIKVQGVRVQTKHDKKEGIQKKEGFIHYSNVKFIQGPPAKKAKKKKVSKKAEAAS